MIFQVPLMEADNSDILNPAIEITILERKSMILLSVGLYSNGYLGILVDEQL